MFLLFSDYKMIKEVRVSSYHGSQLQHQKFIDSIHVEALIGLCRLSHIRLFPVLLARKVLEMRTANTSDHLHFAKS